MSYPEFAAGDKVVRTNVDIRIIPAGCTGIVEECDDAGTVILWDCGDDSYQVYSYNGERIKLADAPNSWIDRYELE